MFFLPCVIFIIASFSAYSQKYSTAADTVELNKEYLKVSNNIADLTSKLTIAQNNLPGYHTKAGDAVTNAKSSMKESSEQASKATNGDLAEAKSSKKKANKALDAAEDAKDADNKVKDQDKKIAKLSAQLKEKQDRLQELETMRTAIRSTNQ